MASCRISKILALSSLIALGFNSCSENSSSKDVWLSFTEENSDLYGFTDASGRVMIEPQFTGGFSAKVFRNIVAVMTQKAGVSEQYYLLKNGQKIGVDSVYAYNSRFDCEHEGHIRFRDPQSYYTGLMDSIGRIIIAPDYNELSPVHNGFLLATRQAQKIVRPLTEGQDIAWIGGTTSLINIKSETIISEITHPENLNLHSISVSDTPPEVSDSTITFHGNDNKYYTFIDNKKCFEKFYKQIKNDIMSAFDNSLIIWSKDAQWTDIPSEDFKRVNASAIKDFETYISDTTNVVFFNVQNFLPLSDSRAKEFEKYKDDCDNWNTMQYPIYEIAYIKGEEDLQSLYCIKTASGFKIVSVKF